MFDKDCGSINQVLLISNRAVKLKKVGPIKPHQRLIPAMEEAEK